MLRLASGRLLHMHDVYKVHSRFVLIETPRGRGAVQEVEVADSFRYLQVRRQEEYNELHETIEHMNEMPGGLMFTMKRNHKLLGEVPELGENAL